MSTDNPLYQVPESIEDAEVRIIVLEQNIQIITDHLSDENREKQEGYLDWKAKAQDARGYKRAEVAFLVRWLELRDPDKGFKLRALRTMLAASVPILRRAGDAGLLSADELAYVNHMGTLVSEPVMITGGFNAEA